MTTERGSFTRTAVAKIFKYREEAVPRDLVRALNQREKAMKQKFEAMRKEGRKKL
jgi:hypothetical protein